MLQDLFIVAVCALWVCIPVSVWNILRLRRQIRALDELLTPSQVARYRPRSTSTWREDD